ncbi:UDP-N-acetylglucosamine 4-epimerase [subsurface metagenome]
MEHSKSTQDGQPKTALITGGCGFIGTNLVKYLADRGYQIRILDNLSTGKEENLRKLQSQDSRLLTVDLIIGDIRNQDVVSEAVKGVDAVVHLAAHSSVIDSLENPKETWDINVVGTLNLLEACRQKGVAKFILASSNAVVGEQPPPIDELKMPKPLSPYGASKLAAEALCSSYYHSFGLRTISLRFANCYGPYSEHKPSIISRVIRWAKEEKPVIIYGDGNQTRDFIHVDDVCQAIHLSLIAKDLVYGEVFQIASGVETTINSLARLIKEITERELPIIYEPERKGEIRRNYSDISKARRLLKFRPEIGLRDGLFELWKRRTP